jgi:LuxR family maltose regulon positive regulatory protein
MTRSTPTVWLYRAGGTERAELEQGEVSDGAIQLDSAAWWAWLGAANTTRFAYPIADPTAGWICGRMTVRKERRRRGGDYWVAYWRANGRLRKIYLGRSEQVTAQRLATAAAQFFTMTRAASSAAPEGGEARQA